MKSLLFTAGILLLSLHAATAQNSVINGAKQYQTIRGLGVNINPQSWNVNPDAVKKVIDSLVLGMGCTSFRLMYDDCDWEFVNDNTDPDTYNWEFYDSVYSAPRFTCVWNTIAYLNSLGITDITLSPDGAAPAWMGGTKMNAGAEAEYAEMMASMVYYGINRRSPAIHFSLLSPINETTCGGDEGTLMTPQQLGTVFSLLAAHLIKDNMTAVNLVGPDDCDGWPSSFHAIISDPATMSKLSYFGGHQYGNTTATSRGLLDSVSHSAYPDKQVVLTEVNTVCNGCDGGTYNKDYGFTEYAGPAYQYVLQHLNAGISGIQIWEGYDSRYHHPNRFLTWSMWGIFAVNDTSRPDNYSVRTHYYVFKQLYRFVKPGFKRIEMTTSLPKMTISAFFNPADGSVVITGRNNSNQPQTMTGIFKKLNSFSTLKYYFTDAQHNFTRGPNALVAHGAFSKLLPANSVFTLVGN